MRSLSILLGYSLLAAALYRETQTKPAIDQSAEVVQMTLTKKKKASAAAALHRPVETVKKDSPPENPDNLLRHLTARGWRMRAVVSDKPCDTDGDGYETTDIFAEMPPCAKDDVLFIRKNGRAVYQRGLPCADEPATQSYAWTLSEDGLFTMTAGSIVAEMYLASVDAKTLKMIVPMEAQGKEYRFTITYTH